ncbi:uncharacterized protein [Triticum aestivum]|uniref:uncharacterized protein n=1 Tax=Triticum aestivum TaxID=4565 RepID=UPI001D023074|nr:uncharacterized protein LOC123050881 [Triticum aestivum]
MSRSSSPISTTDASVAGVVQVQVQVQPPPPPPPRESESESEAPPLLPQISRMFLLELKLQEERLNHSRRTGYGGRSSSVPGCWWRRKSSSTPSCSRRRRGCCSSSALSCTRPSSSR